MRRAALTLLALLAAATGCRRADRKRPQRLNLYCSTQIEWCEKTKVAFERDTGIKVAMIRKSTGEALAQIRAERRSPKADVWWGGTADAHLQAAEANLLDKYASPLLPQLHPWAVDPEGRGRHRTTGVYMGLLGFGYNREWLNLKGLAPPTQWSDLLGPDYRGEIQMANPNSSGTAYTILATVVQLFGDEQGFVFLRKLHANVNQYTKSGAAPVRAAARGETAVGIVFLHDAMTQREAGFPIELVAPSEGTGFEIGCVSIVRGARHLSEARAFVDWSLGERAQNLAKFAHAFQLPANRNAEVPVGAPRVEGVNLIDFDFVRFSQKAERRRLLERWDREVKSQ